MMILPYGAPVDFDETPQPSPGDIPVEGEAITNSESALEREIAAEAATAPDLSDPPVAVAVNQYESRACEGKASNADGSKTSDGRARSSGPEPIPLGLDAGATAPGREPIGLPNPFNRMDRIETSTVQPDSGTVLDSEHDARPITSPGGRTSTDFECPDIPEFLRRVKRDNVSLEGRVGR